MDTDLKNVIISVVGMIVLWAAIIVMVGKDAIQ
jgi:hypothetical protein